MSLKVLLNPLALIYRTSWLLESTVLASKSRMVYKLKLLQLNHACHHGMVVRLLKPHKLRPFTVACFSAFLNVCSTLCRTAKDAAHALRTMKNVVIHGMPIKLQRPRESRNVQPK